MIEYILTTLAAFLAPFVVASAPERVQVRDCWTLPELRRDLRRRPLEGNRLAGTSAE